MTKSTNPMTKKNSQQGGALPWLLLFIATLVLLSVDYLPAEAEELKAVVALAESSPKAKAVLVEALRETPSPNQGQLIRMRRDVNKVIVEETAREVTGDASIVTPSERSAAEQRNASAQRDEIQSKPWDAMTAEERRDSAKSKWPWVVVATLFVLVIPAGLFAMWRFEGRGPF